MEEPLIIRTVFVVLVYNDPFTDIVCMFDKEQLALEFIKDLNVPNVWYEVWGVSNKQFPQSTIDKMKEDYIGPLPLYDFRQKGKVSYYLPLGSKDIEK